MLYIYSGRLNISNLRQAPVNIHSTHPLLNKLYRSKELRCITMHKVTNVIEFSNIHEISYINYKT